MVAVFVAAITAPSAAHAEPLPFRLALRAFTAGGEVRVFDGQTLYARPQAGGRWRQHGLPAGRVFDVQGEGDRLWILDEAGVLVQGGDRAKRLKICKDAGSLAVARETLWCASPADDLNRVTVWRFSTDGNELDRWSVQLPPDDGDANLPGIARLARAWWFLLADQEKAVGVSLNRSQLLLVPAQGQPRVVSWSSPLEEFRLRRPLSKGAQPRLPEGHLRGALLLPGGQLLLLPAITGIDEQGVVTQADRLLLANWDGTVSRSYRLPRPAAALVRDPADPLILYQDGTLQPLRQLAAAPASSPTS